MRVKRLSNIMFDSSKATKEEILTQAEYCKEDARQYKMIGGKVMEKVYWDLYCNLLLEAETK